jgi:DNA polymerase-4
MNEIVAAMVEKLAFELRRQQKLTSCVTVKIRYSNFDTHTLQKRITYTSFDHTLIQVAKELFARLYTRRLLIRLIGVKFSYLVHGFQQLNLFEDTPQVVNMYLAMDRIRKKYGNTSIRRAIALAGKGADIGAGLSSGQEAEVVPYPFMRR